MPKVSIDLKSATLKTRKELVVGIDLGTTNSLIAVVENGKPTCIAEENGKTLLVPSILYLDETNQWIVGEEAKKQLSKHPNATVYSVKRLMGKSFQDITQLPIQFSYSFFREQSDSLVKINMQGQYYTPVELSALILRKLKSNAEAFLKQEIEKAVITVPAYFNDNQRQATRDAGKLAGLDVLRIINEPTAASLAYGIGIDPNDHKTVLVYDLGGGTFDISILRIEQGIFEVLATNGDNFLGGDDIDQLILEYWAKTNNFLIPSDPGQRNELRLLAEKAKIALSHTSKFVSAYLDLSLELSAIELAEIAKPIIDKTLHCCSLALKDCKLTISELNEIILVGGVTRLPYVKERLSLYFQRTILDTVHPEEAVALGAAIQADILSGNRKDLLLLDVTPLSLGIETLGGLMDVIVPRNTKIPIDLARNYTTSKDSQSSLKIAVYQGERDLVMDNRKLAEFTLKNIPSMPAGLPKIEVRFTVDADGILKIKATELRSGSEQFIEVKSQFSIPQEEMAQMLKDSLLFAKQDRDTKALIDTTNEAKHLSESTIKFLQQNASWLTSEQNSTIQRLLSELDSAIQNSNKALIENVMEELNHYAAPLAHLAMNHIIQEQLGGKKIKNL